MMVADGVKNVDDTAKKTRRFATLIRPGHQLRNFSASDIGSLGSNNNNNNSSSSSSSSSKNSSNNTIVSSDNNNNNRGRTASCPTDMIDAALNNSE